MNQLAIIEPSIYQAIERANLADSTRVKYRRAIERFQATGGDLRNPSDLAEHAQGLSNSGRAFLRAGLALVVAQARQDMNAQADVFAPDVVKRAARMDQADRVFDTALAAVKVKAQKGEKAHLWLSQAQVKALLVSCDKSTLSGHRDYIALALCVGAGLRRLEAVSLTFDSVLLQPVKGKFRTVLQVHGKGSKDRVVPISDKLANALDDWRKAAGITSGRILRSIARDGQSVRESLSAVGLFNVVAKRGAMIGKAELAPHDLRRTFAQLGFEAGVSIVQISRLLGHASVTTTQRYLNLELDLESTVSDFIPL